MLLSSSSPCCCATHFLLILFQTMARLQFGICFWLLELLPPALPAEPPVEPLPPPPMPPPPEDPPLEEPPPLADRAGAIANCAATSTHPRKSPVFERIEFSSHGALKTNVSRQRSIPCRIEKGRQKSAESRIEPPLLSKQLKHSQRLSEKFVKPQGRN